ncbi:MAG: site-specific integrase [Chloroflexota bacterium]
MAVDQTTMIEDDVPVSDHESIDSNSTLMACVLAYQDHMKEMGFSDHTYKAFTGDLRLLQNYYGPDRPVHELGNQELNQFLYWLQYERGVPCSPKSYARRVTTLKNFFGWLTKIKVTIADPAAAIIHQRVVTQLPPTLENDEVDRLLEATEAGLSGVKPDARPHLLVNLVLQTGIKKAECMRLTADDFEQDDPKQPTVLIRYSDPRLLHKERRLEISPEVMTTLEQYIAEYQPSSNIFECTPRNLEYVLADAAKEAKIANGVSFESLRWTCALRDFRDGLDDEKHRYKMGLSKVTWRETLIKLEKLNSGQDKND